MALQDPVPAHVHSQFTVGELMRSGILGQSEVMAGSSGLHRVIKSVTVLTAPDPEKWLLEGQVLLTNGYPFKDHPESYPELVEILARHGCAALCMQRERFVPQFPAEAVKRADTLSFPVLTITGEPGWIQTIERINARLNWGTTWLQSQVLDICLRQYPTRPLRAISTVVSLVREAVGYRIEVLDQDKDPVCQGISALELDDDRPAPASDKRSCADFEEMRSAEGVVGYIGFCPSPGAGEPHMPSDIADLIRSLMGSQLLLHKARRDLRAARSRLMEDASMGDPALLRPAAIGLSEDTKAVRVVAISDQRGGLSGIAGSCSDLFLEEFEHAISGPSMRLRSGIIGLTSLDRVKDNLTRFLVGLSGRPARHLACGISALKTLDNLAGGIRQALAAAASQRILGDICGPVVSYEEIGPDLLLLGSDIAEGDESLKGLLEEAKALSGSDGEMLKTLQTYLEADCSMKRAAMALHVHPNTLKYRLQKIKSKVSLGTFEDKVRVYLALKWREARNTTVGSGFPLLSYRDNAQGGIRPQKTKARGRLRENSVPSGNLSRKEV